MKWATLCYVQSGGKTLMVHRVKKQNDMHQGKWNGLGGKLESGETPEECAAREIYEESGLRATSLKYKGLLTFPGFANEEDWYAFVFIADQFEGELTESPEGILEWVENEHLLELNLWDGDHIFLQWLDHPGVFSGKFNYRDGHLVDYQVTFYEY